MVVNLAQIEKNKLEGMLTTLKQGNPAQGSEAETFYGEFANTARSYLVNTQRLIDNELGTDLTGQNHKRRELIISKSIERLLTEWQRIEPIYKHLLQSNTQTTNDTDAITTHIQSIFTIARTVMRVPTVHGSGTSCHEVVNNIELEIIPQFDISFSMLRAPYYPQKVLLTVPIYTMPFTEAQKIIWHEIASVVVNPDNKIAIPDSTTESSYLPHVIYPKLNDFNAPAIDWSSYPNTTFVLTNDSTIDQTLNEGWQYFWMYWAKQLLPRMQRLDIHALPKKADFPLNRKYLVDWRVSHLEELVEDACSTLVFGADVYKTFLEVFERYYQGILNKPDMRHPSPQMRLEVTYQLLKLMGESDQISPMITHDDGTQELSFVDPLTHLHNKISGAKEIAKWIYDNRSNLIIEPDDWTTIRANLKNAGHQLDSAFEEQRQTASTNILTNDLGATAATFEELDLTLFARIDPNAGTSPAIISPNEITPIIAGGAQIAID